MERRASRPSNRAGTPGSPLLRISFFRNSFLGTISAHGLPSENGTDSVFLRGSGARADDDLGWGDESSGGEAPARDEAGGAAGDLPHRRRKKRGGDGVRGGGGCERSQESAGED